MLEPRENVGKICISLEKYFDVNTNRIRVKPRPMLIIGFEEVYNSPYDIDYELLPISKINSFEPDQNYDIYLDENKIQQLGLNYLSYIRSHKTTWNHCRHMRIDSPIGDLKSTYPDLFEKIMLKNHQWVQNRTNNNITKPLENAIKDK